MEGRKLNIVLRDRAREFGLCDEWYKGWDKDSTRQELIEKYLRGIDFCIEHDYPRVEFIKAQFPRQLLERNGIFADCEVDGDNIGTCVLLGSAHGVLRYHGFCSCSVYVVHKGCVDIQATDGARVFVEVYGESVVMVSADDTSRVFVYQHGGNVKVDGNVTIRDKR